MVANKYAFLQITRRRFLNEWEAFKKVIRDRKSGSAGMPRPTSYAVFCLKKKRAGEDGAAPGRSALGAAGACDRDAPNIDQGGPLPARPLRSVPAACAQPRPH